MPKGKLTEEEKEQIFNEWKAGDEYAAIMLVHEKRPEKLEQGTLDVSDDWTEFLAALWQCVQTLKVPGRKAKGKSFFRQLTPAAQPSSSST